MQLDDKETCREYGMRGHRKREAEGALLIEGEYINATEIARRIGAESRKQIYKILKKAQAMDGPVTFDRLRSFLKGETND